MYVACAYGCVRVRGWAGPEDEGYNHSPSLENLGNVIIHKCDVV